MKTEHVRMPDVHANKAPYQYARFQSDIFQSKLARFPISICNIPHTTISISLTRVRPQNMSIQVNFGPITFLA